MRSSIVSLGCYCRTTAECNNPSIILRKTTVGCTVRAARSTYSTNVLTSCRGTGTGHPTDTHERKVSGPRSPYSRFFMERHRTSCLGSHNDCIDH